MLAKLFQKPILSPHYQDAERRSVTSADLDPRVVLHFGIPSTTSLLVVDPIQGLLAMGTLDGRIKVIGGDNIEGEQGKWSQLSRDTLDILSSGLIRRISFRKS